MLAAQILLVHGDERGAGEILGFYLNAFYGRIHSLMKNDNTGLDRWIKNVRQVDLTGKC